MTRILFIPDEQTILLLESPLPPEETEDEIRCGQWQPPPPYHDWQETLYAVRLGRMVIASPLQFKDVMTQSDTPHLSPRQAEVLQYLAEGLTNKQIAARLRISSRAVEHHITSLKRNMGTNNRAQSVSKAAGMGLLE